MDNLYYVIIIVLVIILIARCNTSTCEDYLYGAWCAEDDDFCEEAEIDNMVIFIGKPTRGWFGNITRQGYLIIMPGLCQQSFTMCYRAAWCGPKLKKYTVRASIEFDDDQIWDKQCDVSVDILRGTMKIKGCENKVVYADVYKQHDVTNIADSLEDTKLVDSEEVIASGLLDD